jgi:inositol hexakisphosphate/diphosphoinositol-pentakisphosphate kinase
MDRKAQSKPMKEIISRLTSYGDFEVLHFGDEVS